MSGLKRLAHLAGFFIPHFATDELAVNFEDCSCGCGKITVPACMMKYVEPGERYDGIVTLKSFAFLWWGLHPRQVGEVRPFVNPHDEVTSERI